MLVLRGSATFVASAILRFVACKQRANSFSGQIKELIHRLHVLKRGGSQPSPLIAVLAKDAQVDVSVHVVQY